VASVIVLGPSNEKDRRLGLDVFENHSPFPPSSSKRDHLAPLYPEDADGGDGTITVVSENEPGKFGGVSTIETQASARTMALDPKTYRPYLSAATEGPPRAGGAGRRRGGRPRFVPVPS
jgi:hypothetical protein